MSEFSMFFKKFGFMHACILHVLSVRLTRVDIFVSTEHYISRLKFPGSSLCLTISLSSKPSEHLCYWSTATFQLRA